ncbi:MAG: pentose-5-phosphate 3-epimerase [Clostridiales bacterium]|nr:pentose-5-phosphate 3-epimerase [Clostridiales bacterium]
MKHIKIAPGIARLNYSRGSLDVKEAMDAGADIVHADAADMHELPNLQLMGGHQVVEGFRAVTDKPIECHFYTSFCDRLFIEKLARVGCDMLILPAERFLGSNLAYIMMWCQQLGLKFGLTLGCYTPLSFVEEAIYDIDRLHIVTHGITETDGKDNWYWRPSVPDLIKRARRMIDEKNPGCELAIDGGIRANNVEPLIACNPDVVVLSSAIFKHEKGITYAVKEFRGLLDEYAKKYNLE